MTTPWIQDHLAQAAAAFKEQRDRTGLKHLLTVLSVYPEQADALKLAGSMIYLNRRKTYAESSKEPLLGSDHRDPRLDRLFCSCEAPGCRANWISARVGMPDFPYIAPVNSAGGQCTHCGRYSCRQHYRIVGIMAQCPRCGGELDSAPQPNGRSSLQTVRLNKPLAFVLLLTEGPVQPPTKYVQEILDAIAPDAFEDHSKIVAFPIGEWQDDAEELAMALVASKYPEFLSKEYDLHRAVIADHIGARLAMVKAFVNRPKIVDPE